MPDAATHITAILGAMPEEIDGIRALMELQEEETIGMRTYYRGRIHGKEVVLAFSRWGKVAAATTVTTMIQRYAVSEVIFTGLAGAVSPVLRIGDIVMADKLYQHDMDARPLMKKFEIPLLDTDHFRAAHPAKKEVAESLSQMLNDRSLHRVFSDEVLHRYNLHHPGFFTGDIASGDHFFSDDDARKSLLADLPDILCVEMEGAAVAQVCYEHGIPLFVIRVISDEANHQSAHEFSSFVRDVASKYTTCVIDRVIPLLHRS